MLGKLIEYLCGDGKNLFFILEELCLIGTLLSPMDNEKYDYRDSALYQQWMEDCEQSEELMATEGRIAKRIVVLAEYIRRAALRPEAVCRLELMNLARATQLAASVTVTVRELSRETIIQMLDSIRSNVLDMEAYLQKAGATISEDHNLQQLFSQRERLLSAQ